MELQHPQHTHTLKLHYGRVLIIHTYIFIGTSVYDISIVNSIRSINQKTNFTGEQFQNFYTQCVTSVACSIHFTGGMS